MKNDFFSRAVRWPAWEPNAALNFAHDSTCLSAFALNYISIRRISFSL